MCGIVFLSIKNGTEDLVRRQVERGMEAIKHRGPDSMGVWIADGSGNRKVGLGHVRLSILDQSEAGRQPMVSRDESIAMAFNGEIYNFKTIRKDVRLSNFNSTGDSEVLLEGFAENGIGWFRKLRGMFAAVFYNNITQETIVVRDQLGIKPVYYYQSENTFAVCSEIKGLKAMLPEIGGVCKESLFEFLSCGFVFEPDTGIQGVKKVPPGSFLKFSNGTVKILKYFDLVDETKNGPSVERSVLDAIREQTIADAKIGVFFSGGLDSTIIASTVKLPCIFARHAESSKINGDLNPDEAAVDCAKDRLNIEVEKINITDESDSVEMLIESIRQVAAGTEELISDFTFYASQSLAFAAKAKGYKVMLSGMGGDETFLGYPRYKVLVQSRRYKIINYIVQRLSGWKIFSHGSDLKTKSERLNSYYSESDFSVAYSRLLGYLSETELRDLIGDKEYSCQVEVFKRKCDGFIGQMMGDSNIAKAAILDYYGFLSHNLTVADKSSMIAGVELRVPLLDQDLYCNNIAKIRVAKKSMKVGKTPLREILKDLFGQSYINRKKVGFNPSIDRIIEKLGQDVIRSILLRGAMLDLFNKKSLESLLDKHFSGQKYNSLKIWQMLYLSMWLTENNLQDHK